jgi:hypothetical protein
MQLAAAGLLGISALFSLITTFIFVNHDTMLNVMQAQGSLPSGTNVDQVVNVALFVAYAFVILIVAAYRVAALGSYLGWRWMFWVVLVLCGFGTIRALTNLSSFSRTSTTEVPTWALGANELFYIASAALFVWMLIGVITRGPWAMKKPGA